MKKLSLLLSLLFLLLPAAAFAGQEMHLLTGLPLLGTAEGSGTIVGYLNAVFALLLSASAILAVIFIAIGGFEMMSKDTPFYISEGKDRIYHSIIGLLIILASYIILNTINPDLVRLDIFRQLSAQGALTDPGMGTTPDGSTAAHPLHNTMVADEDDRQLCLASGCRIESIGICRCDKPFYPEPANNNGVPPPPAPAPKPTTVPVGTGDGSTYDPTQPGSLPNAPALPPAL